MRVLITRAAGLVSVASLLGSCTGSTAPVHLIPEPPAADQTGALPDQAPAAAGEPMLPPRFAKLLGYMPLRSTGAEPFRFAQPKYDGRGVVIAILDSGIDAGVAGLANTTTGERKILDLRDFSGEGRITLAEVEPDRVGTIQVAGVTLTGFGRVARLARKPYFGGVLRERTLGRLPAADINGDGVADDAFALVVARGSRGWFVIVDTDGDGRLDDESPVYDFAVDGETFTLKPWPDSRSPGPMTIAANITENDGYPVLDLFMDNSSHGTHVAGIAAGHGLFGVDGFDGVAPGAYVLGLKIADNLRGGISVTGSMLRALNYAADFAGRRGLPLVANLSYGVGHDTEGRAAIDSIVDEFALRHPDVLVVISVGNDGPGLSSVWLPGSASYALTVCALIPGVFARVQEPGRPAADDVVAWWSSRGAEVAKPDLCAPGIAFSSVPPWRVGEEISSGTSMATPHVAGLAALLMSAMRQARRPVRAIDLKRALVNTATSAGGTVLDQGAGTPDVRAAHQWLLAGHQSGVYHVTALPDGANSSTGAAAYRRTGLAGPADTLQRFRIASVGGQPAALLVLEPDVPWLHVPGSLELSGGPGTVAVTYDAGALEEPGLYVGTVWAHPSTDEIAGPSFGLVNTVIVPHSLDSPVRSRGILRPGGVARYFLEVPPGAPGLVLEATVLEGTPETTLHLFEPTGRPARGRRSVAVGGEHGESALLMVRADDLQEGVYEAVLVGPPADTVSYRFAASIPTVAVASVDGSGIATLHNGGSESVEVTVSSVVLGATRTERVAAGGSSAARIRLTAPQWARRVHLEIRVPPETWRTLTDFGVTLYDSEGRKLGDGPLNYAMRRMEMELDSTTEGGVLEVELMPAFAHLTPLARWTAAVRVTFAGGGAAGADSGSVVMLSPGERREVKLNARPAYSIPDGYRMLVEVAATDGAGLSAVRRAEIAPPSPVTDSIVGRKP